MELLFYPFFLSIASVLIIIYLSYKKGRVFCAYACPVHFFLEISLLIKEKFRPAFIIFTGTLLSVIIAAAMIFFLFTFSQIREFMGNNQSFYFLIIIYLIMAVLFFLIFVIYKEKFCKKACPYALIQMAVQTNETKRMIFDNSAGECINCFLCDGTCPFLLNVRKESKTLFCSNCNRCHDACVKAIGIDRVVLNIE